VGTRVQTLIDGLKTQEVLEDCCWDDNTRAKWFSWFLTGPAKTTWQCSLKQEDKESWPKIIHEPTNSLPEVS